MVQATLATTIPSLIGSSLSFLASTIFAILYIMFRPRQHIRQFLIVNLLVADWINSLNNTVSGLAIIANWRHANSLSPGPACTANGYIGQFSVQAIDFNILVIAVTVLMTVYKNHIMAEPSTKQIILMCAIPWIMPIITSNIALGLGIYGPVVGNWCWITDEYVALRYALTHGWRLAIFVATITMYTMVYVRLKRAFGQQDLILHRASMSQSTQASHVDARGLDVPTCQTASSHPEVNETDEQPLHHVNTGGSFAVGSTVDGEGDSEGMSPSCTKRNSVDALHVDNEAGYEQPRPVGHRRSLVGRPTRQLRKMLLLNGYPILYILLWIPGIANRICEAVGVQPEWLGGLQATTQFMGLGDVLTYAYNEQLTSQIREYWQSRRGSRWSSV